jgi:CO/xanthine dehydrogenase Mo-binding subunit
LLLIEKGQLARHRRHQRAHECAGRGCGLAMAGLSAMRAPTARSALPIWRSARRRSLQAQCSSSFNSADGTYPNGTHLAEVEIDPATGIIKIVNYVIVDDFGVTLNPLMLAARSMAARCRALDKR